MVNGRAGLLIFPDDYNGTTTVSGTGIATVNSTSASYPLSSIPTDTWTTMESAGVVFLPSAGGRYGSAVWNAGSIGNYWSSTPSKSGSAYYMFCNSNNVNPCCENLRVRGRTVRLVSVVSE